MKSIVGCPFKRARDHGPMKSIESSQLVRDINSKVFILLDKVSLGQPLTIVVAINDHKNHFDMKVKSCFAHDGIKQPIYLIDEDGCVLRPKMISPFKKIRNNNGKASLIAYAQFLAFKFPDSVDVQIQCTVEVCRHGCIDTCHGDSDTNNYIATSTQSNQNKNINVKLDIPGNKLTNNHFFVKNSDLIQSANEASVAHSLASPPEENINHSPSDKNNHLAPEMNPRDLVQEFDLNRQHELNEIASFLQNENMKANLNDTRRPISSSPTKPFKNIAATHLNNNPNNRLNWPSRALPYVGAPNRQPIDPVAQIMNVPISPLYLPKQAPFPVNRMPNNGKLFNKKPPLLPHLFNNYFGKNRNPQNIMTDHERLASIAFAHIPSHRTKRFIQNDQSEIGLKRGFQVVTSLDLSFMPNMSTDQMPIYEGIRAPVVYGVCISRVHLLYAFLSGFLMLFIGLATCIYIVRQMDKLKRKG